MHNLAPRIRVGFLVMAFVGMMSAPTWSAEKMPDLTKGETKGVDRNGTYNLGATGFRGWIYSQPISHFDGLQGRTTQVSRQILVTHIGAKSPADGVLQVNDVILGVGDKPFSDDARKSLAVAIQEAEQEANHGNLKLLRWRSGETTTVTLKLRVMGTYSATAPFDCAKSKRILAEACKALEKERLDANWCGAINGLALMASGNPEYLPRVREFAHKIGPASLKLELKDGMTIWEWGYKNIFLSEYYLLTQDQEVLPAIKEFTVTMAKGQSMYGTIGHGVSGLTPDGKLHGSIPPYGPVNEAGLVGNLAIAMGRKCGVKDPELEPAITRAAGFFGYFMNKGTIPYGEHEPWPYHENNGKGSIAAVMFLAQGNHRNEAQFFAKMSVAGYRSRECGHTGQGFSYLWSALGANVGGPTAAAAFIKESSWHLDLVRRSDGAFTYDGDEQFGPGKTDDNTYYGASSYNGLSPNATYVLTYSLPLQKLFITGKGSSTTNWLSKNEVTEAVASGAFDLERKRKSTTELVAAFSDWSPIVRSWAAEELCRRPEARAMIPELLTMAEGKNANARQGACETLGYLKSKEALPVYVRLLSHEDRWLRYKAAQAIERMRENAKSALPEILKALVDTAEPLQPVVWADPIQLAHGQLASAIFAGGLTDALKTADAQLVYAAIRVISKNADGMARATLRNYFEEKLTLEDMIAIAPDVLAAVKVRAPADTMFGNEIRMGGFKALAKFHFKEGIDAGIDLAKTQGGHGSENRTVEIMKAVMSYGSAAQYALPKLKEVIAIFNEQVRRKEYPDGPDLNGKRVRAVEDAIAFIEKAKTHPELRSATAESSKK